MSTASFEYGFSVVAGAGPGASDGDPRPIRDRVVQERLVDADELPASVVGIGRWAGRQPAHELADGRLDLAPEEQPAVARQRVPDAVRQLADDPEVDVADRVAGQDEQVGRVQVGVEVAEHVDLVEHVPVEVPDDPVEVVAARREGLEVGGVALALGDHDVDQRDALDELGRQDARRRVVAVDPRDPLELVAARVLPEQDGLARLDQVVELVGGPARELVDDLAAAGRPEEVRPVEQPGHRRTSGRCRPASVSRMPGSLDLDGHRLAAVEDRAVDLADRRRRERLRARTSGRSPPARRRAPAGRSRGPRRTRTARPGSGA